MGLARASGHEETVDLAQSGSVISIEIDDFEHWSWRLQGDGSNFSEFDGGLLRHNIFNAFRFDIVGVDSKFYNSSFAVFEQKIYLAFNFSKEFDDKVFRLTLRDTLLGDRHLTQVGLDNNLDEHGEEIRRTSQLVLVNQTIEFAISGREQVPEETLTDLKGTAFLIGRLTLSVAIIFGFMNSSLVVASLSTGAAFIQFLQTL